MFKNLPDSATDTLLGALNYIWTTGNFPSEWYFATVIPIAKSVKNSTDPISYRPIASNSCLCKVMERMVNTRLVQSNFRKQRSTSDQIVCLETFVRETFVNKTAHCCNIF